MPNFTITPSTGTGLTTVSATPVSQNLTYSAKTGTVTISNGQSTKTVSLRQNGLPHTIPSMETVHIPSSGGVIPFDVESDFIFCFSGYTTSDWVVINNGSTVQPPEGSTGGPMVWGIYPDIDTWDLSMVAGANTGSQRTATIYLDHYYNDAGTITKAPYAYTMNISQDGAGGHYLTIASTLMEVDDLSSPMVNISSDVSWAVTSAPSFLDMLTTTGTGNGYIWFEPKSASQKNEMQRGVIVVSDTQGLGLSQTLVVYYKGDGLTKGLYYISQTGFSHTRRTFGSKAYEYDDVYIYHSTAITPSLTVTAERIYITEMYLLERNSSYTPPASDYGNHLSLTKGVEYKLKIRVDISTRQSFIGDTLVYINGSNNSTYGIILERIN